MHGGGGGGGGGGRKIHDLENEVHCNEIQAATCMLMLHGYAQACPTMHCIPLVPFQQLHAGDVITVVGQEGY